MAEERLLIFGKVPREGRVKTRLEPFLATTAILGLYRCLVRDLVARISRHYPGRCLFYHEPDEPGPDLIDLGLPLEAQRGGDLGARMAAGFDRWLATGIERVVVIGCDSPDLPIDRIEKAFQSLREHDVVLGPAIDGGYYLIGLSKMVPELFQGVNWGGTDVLRQTLDRVKRTRASLYLLEPWYDVDHPEDLRFLATHLEARHHSGLEERCPRTRELLRKLLSDS